MGLIIIYLLMKGLLLVCVLAVAVWSRSYPLYKQCDPKWGNEHLGTSATTTICKAGCAMSSVAMGLSGTGHSYNPGTLNTWLKNNGGYVSTDELVWGAVSKIGLHFKGKYIPDSGKFANSQIKSHLDAGNVVVCNVHNGGHWVLATSYSGNTIYVNDPGFSTTSYTLSEIVDGQNAVYGLSANELSDEIKHAKNTARGILSNLIALLED